MTPKLPKFEMWPIEAITPFELNSKKHDDKQVAAIALSIERFGFDQPIVVDKDGVVIKGHGRRLACIKLGLTHIPVLVRNDLTPEQVRAARVADNRVAIGDFDTDLLKQELEAINIEDLRGIFDDKELEFLDADLTTMNTDMFVENLDEAVASQETETEEKMTAADDKRVPLAKAMGFKDIKGADQIFVTRFMAQLESQTSRKGEDAFIAFIKALIPA